MPRTKLERKVDMKLDTGTTERCRDDQYNVVVVSAIDTDDIISIKPVYSLQPDGSYELTRIDVFWRNADFPLGGHHTVKLDSRMGEELSPYLGGPSFRLGKHFR